MNVEEKVILVNEDDVQLGLMPKTEAHIKGILHRAFSVFLFNSNDEMLLQKRALTKYHSPGLWTNACCSHPRDGETVLSAANRRLMEEMGISTDLKQRFSFIYRAELDQGMIEHELDHVLIGTFNGEPVINLEEVDSWKFTSISDLKNDLKSNPEDYTEWFKICLEKTLELRVTEA